MAFLDFHNLLRLDPREEHQQALKKQWAKTNRTNPFWNFVYTTHSQDTSSIEISISKLKSFPKIPGKSFHQSAESQGIRKYAGTFFLISYWLGRNQGFITESE